MKDGRAAIDIASCLRHHSVVEMLRFVGLTTNNRVLIILSLLFCSC